MNGYVIGRSATPGVVTVIKGRLALCRVIRVMRLTRINKYSAKTKHAFERLSTLLIASSHPSGARRAH